MAYATHIKNVHILAKGALPHRPMVRQLDNASKLECWRDVHGLGHHMPVTSCGFEDETGQRKLHSKELQRDWNTLCDRVETPMLVYLHRGHQPDTRCPILQDLLQILDHRGGTHALRVENRHALHDALDLSRGLALRFGLVLVLNDPTQRLCTCNPSPAPLRYMLLANESRSQILRERQVDLSHVAFQPKRSPDLHVLTSEIQ
jgi:hypothetical protein